MGDVSGLTVYLNRSGLNTVETDRERVRSDDDVLVSLENHGKPTHVHLHLDDDLAALGTIEDPHWFVPRGERRDVLLQLTDGATGDGRLEITAGYGQARTKVRVEAGAEETSQASPSPAASLTDDSKAADTEATEEAVAAGRLRDPTVLGAGGGAALLVFLWLLTDLLVALSAGLVAILSGIAVASYYSGWTPFAD